MGREANSHFLSPRVTMSSIVSFLQQNDRIHYHYSPFPSSLHSPSHQLLSNQRARQYLVESGEPFQTCAHAVFSRNHETISQPPNPLTFCRPADPPAQPSEIPNHPLPLPLVLAPPRLLHPHSPHYHHPANCTRSRCPHQVRWTLGCSTNQIDVSKASVLT